MMIYPAEQTDPNFIPLIGEPIIACDHCGIVALDTPRFGWKRWTERVYVLVDDWDGNVRSEEKTILRHHCPVGVQYNECLQGYLIHGRGPEDAVVYEDWSDDAADDTAAGGDRVDGGQPGDSGQGLQAGGVAETDVPAVHGESPGDHPRPGQATNPG